MFQLLGVMLCGLLSVSVAAGEIFNIPQNNAGTVDELVQRIQSRSDFGKRRDPFRPIKKRRSITSSSRKSHPEPLKALPISRTKDPSWKLLGIIHGQHGRQAVIQISPKERVFVRLGLEIVRSGWIIKAISKGEVLLEYPAISPSEKGLSQPKTFILSFPTLGKSY